MRTLRCIRDAFAVLAAWMGLLPASASACAACFSQSDSPMAKGMNAGIFTLLAVITSTLLGIAIFFVYILRRAARLRAAGIAADAVPSLPGAPPFSQPTH